MNSRTSQQPVDYAAGSGASPLPEPPDYHHRHHQEADLYPNQWKNHSYTVYNPTSYTTCGDHYPDKEHFALINARCLEFLCCIGRSTGLDTHTEITQVTHLDDISFIQYIDDFE